MQRRVRPTPGAASPARSGRRSSRHREPQTPATDSGERLVDFQHSPHHCRDNPYIRRGYRRELRSYAKCLYSIVGYLHNETVNIWTHLIGCAVALYLLATLYSTHAENVALKYEMPILYPFQTAEWPTIEALDTISVATFFATAAICLGMSASYHCFLAHSSKVAAAWNRMDFIGITFLIWGTNIPIVRYGFMAHSLLRKTYWGIITASGITTIWFLMHPKARTPEFRRARTYIFITLGVSGALPVFHSTALYGLKATSDAFALPWLIYGGFAYIAGALLYAERLPEVASPGLFDYFGASHQLFHIAILFGVSLHGYAINEAFLHAHPR